MAGSASAAAVSVVLVHGAFADGSGWQPVYQILKADGFEVGIVQAPNLSLEGDVAATKWVVAEQSRPVVLVGHSYGGAVVTEAGNDPKVAALVYIAAWVPDKGESVARCCKPCRPTPHHRRSFHRGMAIYWSIASNSPPHSPAMSTWIPLALWRIRRCLGTLRRQAARTRSRHGLPSRVGTW